MLNLYLCFHILGFHIHILQRVSGVVLCSMHKQELCGCVVPKETQGKAWILDVAFCSDCLC